MNYFPILVQEMEVKIPAPVCKAVAYAATASTSFPSVVLCGKFDSESSLVHPLIGNTSHCHCPHQHHELHCTLLPLKESVKLGWHKKYNLISSKFWLDHSVPVTQHSIDGGKNSHNLAICQEEVPMLTYKDSRAYSWQVNDCILVPNLS